MATSPLRYPGGKAKLFPFFTQLIKQNDLFGRCYCEPYAGGAGLALRLLTSGYVNRVSINDVDASIYAFWLSLLRNNDNFCKLIEQTPVTVEEWYRQKAIWLEGDTKNTLALGFSAYFLNRTNRSGIIEGAGPIGGYAQSGKWKIDVRLIKNKQIENIKCLERYSSFIDVSNIDALEYIDRNLTKKDNFTYLDPPYFVKGQKLYKNFYQPKDHILIAEKLRKKRDARWVVSYDHVPEILSAYSTFEPITYFLNYSAGQKSVGREVIFLSDKIKAPQIEGFNIAA